jgi:cytochrome c-type biogenesis protein CcmH/NrfG
VKIIVEQRTVGKAKPKPARKPSRSARIRAGWRKRRLVVVMALALLVYLLILV